MGDVDIKDMPEKDKDKAKDKDLDKVTGGKISPGGVKGVGGIGISESIGGCSTDPQGHTC